MTPRDYDHTLFELKEWRATSKFVSPVWVFLCIYTKGSIDEKEETCQAKREREDKINNIGNRTVDCHTERAVHFARAEVVIHCSVKQYTNNVQTEK